MHGPIDIRIIKIFEGVILGNLCSPYCILFFLHVRNIDIFFASKATNQELTTKMKIKNIIMV